MNDRTECSVNAPGRIAQFGKVKCTHLFLPKKPGDTPIYRRFNHDDGSQLRLSSALTDLSVARTSQEKIP